MKKSKVTRTAQRVASDILTQFMFVRNLDDFRMVWDNLYNAYDLCLDPFTDTPCSYDDYVKSRAEYERQTMLEKYGHCDGLED